VIFVLKQVIFLKKKTYLLPNSAAKNRNPDFSTHILADTGTVSKYFKLIAVT